MLITGTLRTVVEGNKCCATPSRTLLPWTPKDHKKVVEKTQQIPPKKDLPSWENNKLAICKKKSWKEEYPNPCTTNAFMLAQGKIINKIGKISEIALFILLSTPTEENL